VVTRDDIIARVERIEHSLHEPETAHYLEDELYRAVLVAIAGGAPNPADLAMLALYTLLFDFRRSCS
jgi:hypothetical protein